MFIGRKELSHRIEELEKTASKLTGKLIEKEREAIKREEFIDFLINEKAEHLAQLSRLTPRRGRDGKFVSKKKTML